VENLARQGTVSQSLADHEHEISHRMKKQALEDEELVLRRYLGCALAIVCEVGDATPWSRGGSRRESASSQFPPTEGRE
jgi:hypothetical protein